MTTRTALKVNFFKTDAIRPVYEIAVLADRCLEAETMDDGRIYTRRELVVASAGEALGLKAREAARQSLVCWTRSTEAECDADGTFVVTVERVWGEQE